MVEALTSAVASGDRRRSLIAMRDHLATELANSDDPRAVPALAKELRAVLAEIDAIPASGKESVVDEVAAKRADRRTKAAAAPADPVRDKRRARVRGAGGDSGPAS